MDSDLILGLAGLVIAFGSVIIVQNQRMWGKICGLINIAYKNHSKDAEKQDL